MNKGISLASIVDYLKASEAEVLSKYSGDILCSSLALDSRKVQDGTLFFALSGEAVDGRDYIEEAVSKGAVAVIADDGRSFDNISVPVLTTNNGRKICALTADYFYGHPSQELLSIGVTGTNGKTSVCWLLSHILDDAMSIGTLNPLGTNTTPDSISVQAFLREKTDIGTKALFAEVSSHGLVQERMTGVSWDGAVFTNLSRDHLDYHQSLAEYALAKKLLFTRDLIASEKQNKFAVVNADDEVGQEILALKLPGVRFGSFSFKTGGGDVFLVGADLTLQSTHFEVSVFGEKLELESQLIGAYNVSNILAAITVLKLLDYSLPDIQARLAVVAPVPGRLERVGDNVFIDYAHTPDGLKAVQESLRPLTPGKLITVFGCGGNRDKGKRPLMGQAVAELADYSVVTSDNPRKEDPVAIIEEIIPGLIKAKSGNFQYSIEVDRALAIEQALGMREVGDVVLIAGKGHEDYQEINGVRKSFSDKEICRNLLRGN